MQILKRLPREELPCGFRARTMRRIEAASARRGERLEMLVVTLASAVIVGLVAWLLSRNGFPKVPKIEWGASAMFFVYIGALSLLLLGGDCLLRRIYRKEI